MSDMIGDQMVEAYSMIGLIMALYLSDSVSLDLPQEVPDRAMRTLRAWEALDVEMSMCLLKVSFGSRVSPRIMG